MFRLREPYVQLIFALASRGRRTFRSVHGKVEDGGGDTSLPLNNVHHSCTEHNRVEEGARSGHVGVTERARVLWKIGHSADVCTQPLSKPIDLKVITHCYSRGPDHDARSKRRRAKRVVRRISGVE